MRRLAAAAVLLLATPGAARGDDGPRVPPEGTLAAWEARDAEARWIAVRSSTNAWVPFLAARGEWDLLEWIALTSRGSEALDALAAANAAGWVRCAAWALEAEDSHERGAAGRWLVERRPGLALGWLERFPPAAGSRAAGVLGTLRQKKVAPEDASDQRPPFEPEFLLAPLTPPATLEDLGDRPRAEAGHHYVHQVERALRVLGASTLPGEPWAGRLAALLGHAHPRVRLGAALTYAHRPPGEVPLEALASRVDDAKEAADVRAAAVLGLSYSDRPEAYARLVHVSTEPAHPAWRAAVSRLGDMDDGFAPEAWKDLDASPAGADARAFLDEQAARIRTRVASTSAEDFASRAPTRLLERAAWADLVCDPLEGSLVAWSLAAVRERIAAPVVRTEIERLRDGYEPRFVAPTVRGASPAGFRDRVRRYARSLLAESPPAPGVR